MVKVDNRETMRLLTRRFMKMNWGRNWIAVMSIMLTAMLFTSLFMGCTSLILSQQATQMKQMMSYSHAIAQDLSGEEAERLQRELEQNSSVERWGTGKFLGAGVDRHFGFSVEVRSGDRNMAESFHCTPTEGRMPQKKDEIAVSSLVLDALGISGNLGETVTLTWERDPERRLNQTDTFTVVGIWKGDKAILSQLIWVSQEYADEMAYPATRQELEGGILNGGQDYVVWYHTLWRLNEKTEQIAQAAELSSLKRTLEVNPAYDLMEEDSFSFSSAIILLLFILLAGYLIIYNIFQISVRQDIRVYGLLKNVGTTGKQLKKIVRMQAWQLSAVGIPLGLLLGYLAGVVMAPSLSADAEISSSALKTAETVVSASPILFVAAGLFTLLTVYLSSMKACRLVEQVSPVEALRLEETDQTKRKNKRNFSVSWWGMAAQNMLRNWKKGSLVMVSIALSLVVVNSIVMLTQGYDFEEYQEIFLAADFQLSQMTSTLDTANFNGITPEIKNSLEACPNSESTGYVYYSGETHEMEPKLAQIWKEFAQNYNEYWSDYEKQLWEQVKASNTVTVHYLGINESVFDKLEWPGKACSWKEFQTGKHVVVGYNTLSDRTEQLYYQPGDLFQMNYQDGESKEYTVLGSANIPYALDYPYADIFYLTVLVPEEEYIRCIGNDCAMYAAIDAKAGEDEQVQRYIQDTVLSQNEMINEDSILNMRASFDRYLAKYYTIGGFLAVILALIGVMNFFNTTAASLLSRKKELALLEAVGMTKRQIENMLIAEGILYLAGAFVIAAVIVYFAAERLLGQVLGRAFFFHIHLTILPCVALLPILLIVAVAIPKQQFRKLERESVVERIRNE